MKELFSRLAAFALALATLAPSPTRASEFCKSLLTAEKAGQACGRKLTLKIRPEGSGPDRCMISFHDAKGYAKNLSRLIVLVSPHPAAKFSARSRAAQTQKSYRSLNGLGEAAFLADALWMGKPQDRVLEFQMGGRLVEVKSEIDRSSGLPACPEAGLETLARAIALRLSVKR
jgi:hypothetical protein